MISEDNSTSIEKYIKETGRPPVSFCFCVFFSEIHSSQTNPMKRITAYVLLLAFLLQVGGYYVMLGWMQFRWRYTVEDQLDAGLYDGLQPFTVRIPLSLPYSYPQADERVQGEFEFQGDVYRLVRRKVVNDTLYLLCVRDVNARRLQHQFEVYHHQTHDQLTLSFLGKLYKDFQQALDIAYATPSSVVVMNRPSLAHHITPIKSTPPVPPPERAS